MSDEWKGPGPNLANARNKRELRLQPVIVKDSIAKLEVMKDIKPEYAPVVSIALSVVKAAQVQVEALEDRVALAEERARLAEETVANVRPRLDEIVAQNETLAAHLRAQREIAESERVERSARVEVSKATDSLAELTAATAQLRVAQDASTRETVDLLRAIHQCTIGPHGKSAIQDFTKFGRWEVVDVDGAVIKVCESRKEAVLTVKSLLDEERAAVNDAAETTHDDALDSPRAARRKKQPGEEHVDKLPEPTGIQYEPSKSARRRRSPRLL